VSAIPGDLDGVEVAALGAREWRFVVRGTLAGLVRRLAGLPVVDVAVSEPRLEDVLLGFYREGAG
jgi:hypothetical protein